MGAVNITPAEARTLDTAIRLLRDRHFRNYFNAKDPSSDTAKAQRAIAEGLDDLRARITREAQK